MARRRRTREYEVDLDGLIVINWSSGILFYTRFLNMRPGLHTICFDKSDRYKQLITLQESIDVARAMAYVLTAITEEGAGKEDLARLYLENNLNGCRFGVGIDHVRKTISLSGANLYETLWLKFVFEIVSPGFDDRILLCPACLRWMPRKHALQRFCCARCRDYYNHLMRAGNG